MATYNHCPSYALVIEVPDPDDLENVQSTLDLVIQLYNLVNDHTTMTALIHDLHSEPLSDHRIET